MEMAHPCIHLEEGVWGGRRGLSYGVKRSVPVVVSLRCVVEREDEAVLWEEVGLCDGR